MPSVFGDYRQLLAETHHKLLCGVLSPAKKWTLAVVQYTETANVGVP